MYNSWKKGLKNKVNLTTWYYLMVSSRKLMFIAMTAQCSGLLNILVWLSISVGNRQIFLNESKYLWKITFFWKIVRCFDLMRLFDDYFNIKGNMKWKSCSGLIFANKIFYQNISLFHTIFDIRYFEILL
jgi:hypothetical protein